MTLVSTVIALAVRLFIPGPSRYIMLCLDSMDFESLLFSSSVHLYTHTDTQTDRDTSVKIFIILLSVMASLHGVVTCSFKHKSQLQNLIERAETVIGVLPPSFHQGVFEETMRRQGLKITCDPDLILHKRTNWRLWAEGTGHSYQTASLTGRGCVLQRCLCVSNAQDKCLLRGTIKAHPNPKFLILLDSI